MNILKIVKSIIPLMILIISFSSISQASEVRKSTNTILEIGEQMSNMRHLLETYALIATSVNYKAPEKRLLKGILEYEGTIDSIEKNYKDEAIQEIIKKGKEAWKPVKQALLTALKNNDAHRMRKEGLYIHANIRYVIVELANMKKYILNKNDIKDKDALNAMIEIDTSSQRLSVHYMMKMWGLDDPTIKKHWDKGVKIYSDSVKILKASKYYKIPKFKKLLDDSVKNLRYFKMVFTFDDKFVPVIVQEKASKVSKDADILEEIYLDRILK